MLQIISNNCFSFELFIKESLKNNVSWFIQKYFFFCPITILFQKKAYQSKNGISCRSKTFYHKWIKEELILNHYTEHLLWQFPKTPFSSLRGTSASCWHPFKIVHGSLTPTGCIVPQWLCWRKTAPWIRWPFRKNPECFQELSTQKVPRRRPMFLCKSAWVIAQTMSHISVKEFAHY